MTRALHRGFYQGWDLHPAQLPTRFAATFQFFRAGAAEANERLTAYDEGRTGAVADEPATARALADFLLRGLGLRRADRRRGRTADRSGSEPGATAATTRRG